MADRVQVLQRKVTRGVASERRQRRVRHDLAQPAQAAPSQPLPWLLSALLALGFVLFVVYSWSGYRARYAQSHSGFEAGATRFVELTLVREDIDNLACASNVVSEGLRCGYDGQRQPLGTRDEPRTLRPYYTVTRELLLGAGLWSSKALPATLPEGRFTVTCNYRVTGSIKSAALRWTAPGKFEDLAQSAVVGKLQDCAVPR